MVEFELLVVAAVAGEREIDADDAGFLGASEQPRIGAAGPPIAMVCGSCR